MEQKLRLNPLKIWAGFGLGLGWFWAGFGLVGNTEKKIWADYKQLLRSFFSCFQGAKVKSDNILKIL